MATISLESLLESPTKLVTIDGLGDVKIRKIGAGEYARSIDLIEEGARAEKAFVNQAGYVVAHALVEPSFDPANWEELRDKLTVDVLGKLHEEILNFSGLGMPDEAKEVSARAEAFPAAADGPGEPQGGEAVESAADGEAVEGAAAPA